MGWITLHSISANYPEIASNTDKQILRKFLDLFAETISCPSCRGHFATMYRSYTNQYPNWADSRYNFFLFVVRAHNTVNKRLDKPRPATILECIETLKMLTKNKPAAQFRTNYITYLLSNWAREGGGEGMIQMGNVREMRKINEQYWNLREISFDTISFPEADILQPIVTSPRMLSPYSQTPLYSAPSGPAFGFRLSGGKFSFGKR
jgi:hypothetical protein